MIVLLSRIYAFLCAIWGIIQNAWSAVCAFFRFVWRLFDALPAFFASFPDWLLPLILLSFCVGLCLLIMGRG